MKCISVHYGTCVLFIGLCCIVAAAGHADAEKTRDAEPHLHFKKSVVVRGYQNGRVYSEPHSVKRGDYLWKILRDHYKLSESKISFFCKVARAINPRVKNLDVLYPNQNILVPYKYLPDLPRSDRVHVVQSGEHAGKILRQLYGLPDSLIFSERTQRLLREANPEIRDINRLEKGQRIIIPADIFLVPAGDMPEPRRTGGPDMPVETGAENYSDETRVKDMLSAFAHSFDGTDNRTGENVLSIEGRGAVTLDYARFPLYEFPWGKKILLDYGGRLPDGVKQVIVSEWENAEIVAVREKQDIESILDKVLDAGGFYKVEKGGNYIVNRGNIRVSVSGNWVVFKDELLKNVFIVNLVESGQESVGPEMKEYFSRMGLNIVDVVSQKPAGATAVEKTSAAVDYQKIRPEPVVLTDLVLDIVGQHYERDYNTKIFQNMYSGFSLEVVADRMFIKNNRTHLIDFHGLPERITDIILQQGYAFLAIDLQQDEAAVIAGKVLDFCGAAYKAPPAEFEYHSGRKSTIRLAVPGFLIETPSGDVLLTQFGLNDSVKQFLADMHVKIVQF